MELSNPAAKALVGITQEFGVRPSVIAKIRRIVIDDIKFQLQSHGASVDQVLGKALGYPYYCADPKSFPTATEADGVCTGEHVPESLADEAAGHLLRMAAAINQVLASGEYISWTAHNTLVKGLGSFNGPSLVTKSTGNSR